MGLLAVMTCEICFFLFLVMGSAIGHLRFCEIGNLCETVKLDSEFEVVFPNAATSSLFIDRLDCECDSQGVGLLNDQNERRSAKISYFATLE